MSLQITDAMVSQFKSTAFQVFQQKGSKLRGSMLERTIEGQVDYWERIGQVAAVQNITRHGDTPYTETPNTRRASYPTDYIANDYVDKADIYKILIDPKSLYAEAQAMALGRTLDDVAIAALYAAAATGQAGATSTSFATDWSVRGVATTRSGTTGDWDFSAASTTVANILSLMKDLDKNDVDGSERFIVADPSLKSQLLATTQVSSVDYNSVKALAMGDIDTFAGFKFIFSTRVPVKTGTQYYGFAYQKSSMGISMGQEINTRVTERPDKNYSWQVWSSLGLGALRIQGEGVVRFNIDTAL